MEYWWIWVIVAYLAGSIPFALLIGLAHGTDIREHGSGNVGATNCGRVLGKPWFFVCFALDVLKGALPVLGAGWAMGVLGEFAVAPIAQWKWLAVAAAAPLGHVFPVWLKFKGGKGVATGFGVLLGMFPVLTICAAGALGVWAAVVGVSRYIGLGSSIAALSLPAFVVLVAWYANRTAGQVLPTLVVCGGLAAVVLIRHRGNLARTFAGTEPKVGEKLDEKV